MIRLKRTDHLLFRAGVHPSLCGEEERYGEA